MAFEPRGAGGSLWGLLIGTASFVPAIWAINFSLGKEDLALKLVLLIPAFILAVIFLYFLWGAFNLRYGVHEGGLEVRWATRRIQIPWQDIEGIKVVTGKPILAGLTGISWPGYTVGTHILKGLAAVKMYATRPADSIVLLKTADGYIGVTPAEANGFIRELAQRTGCQVEYIDAIELNREVERVLNRDILYMGLYGLNFLLLVGLVVYLVLFFPGSGAPRLLVLLPALGIGLFAFNIFNCSRLYYFMPNVAYFIWILGAAILTAFGYLVLRTIGG
ncbi:MAG: hypothetical protein GX964_07745 [Syntrophomonadaceae bacterium]|jgi:hypothetical protein|nr:hypothetical protein [Syntrophomonadaceae bacterium]